MGVKKSPTALTFVTLMSTALLLLGYMINITSFGFNDMTWIKIISNTPDVQNYAYCGNHLHGTTTFETPSDYYLFGVPSINDGNSVIFNSCNSTFNTTFSLYNGDWELIQICNHCDNCVVSPIYSGTHYLVLSGIKRAYGNYQLQITCSEQHLTPSPTTPPIQLPVKALSMCRWRSFDDELGMEHLFFCTEEHCGYEPASGRYNEYCMNWGIFCNMETVGKRWFIVGIITIALGTLVFGLWVMIMVRGYGGKSKFMVNVTLFMTIVYGVVCIGDAIVYDQTENCYDDYCQNFLRYVPGLYKCDFYSDGGAMILMWMTGGFVMTACLIYIIGIIILKIVEQRKNKMNGLLQ